MRCVFSSDCIKRALRTEAFCPQHTPGSFLWCWRGGETWVVFSVDSYPSCCEWGKHSGKGESSFDISPTCWLTTKTLKSQCLITALKKQYKYNKIWPLEKGEKNTLTFVVCNSYLLSKRKPLLHIVNGGLQYKITVFQVICIKMPQGQCDGLAGKVTCWTTTRWSEFEPWTPHKDEKREMTSKDSHWSLHMSWYTWTLYR